MSNVFVEVGHGVKVAAEDVVKFAEGAVSVGEKVIKVVADVKALTPEFKTELTALINDVKPIATVLAPVLATGGSNVVTDVAAVEPAIQDIVKLAKDFIAFLPTLEAALKELGTAVTS